MTLTGKRVLVTRPAGRARGLVARLEALGARVDARPTFSIAPPRDEAAARRAAERASRYDWVILTSANGARHFHEAWVEAHGAEASPGFSTAVIGPATAIEIASRGIDPDLVAEDARSEGLAAALRERVGSGRSALVVRPEVGRDVVADTLRAAGVEVDAVVFYRTVPASDVAAIARDVAQGSYHGIVFSSPSSLRFLLSAVEGVVETALGRVTRVAIGPTTAAALDKAGCPAHAVAGSPDDEGIERAVVAAFEATGGREAL